MNSRYLCCPVASLGCRNCIVLPYFHSGEAVAAVKITHGCLYCGSFRCQGYSDPRCRSQLSIQNLSGY
ncbi:hypothetical protein D3C75_735390 [compost metagenome]